MHPVRYTCAYDYFHGCTPRPQRALPLRLGPQIQALLSREGRQTGRRGTGDDRRGSSCAIARGRHVNFQAGAETPHGPALEGKRDSGLRSAVAHATQGRWRLKHPGHVATRRMRERFAHEADRPKLPRAARSDIQNGTPLDNSRNCRYSRQCRPMRLAEHRRHPCRPEAV